MKNGIAVFMSLVLVALISIVPWADAQQKPSNVLIWCQNTNGTSSPCVAGNALDYDSGGGTVNQSTVGIVLPASGGPVAGGTSTNPFRTDPTGTTPQPVTQSGTWTLSANQSVNTAQINGVTPLMGAGNTGTGSHRVTEATDSQLSAGVGATGDAAATAGSTGSLNAKARFMTSILDTISTTLTSILTALQLIDDDQTGASVHYRTSAGSTEDEHEVKGSAGRLFSITATNTNAAVRYLRCANQVIGSTTPGTTTVFLGLAIPGATTGAGFTTSFGPSGVAFSTGLTCWLVTGAADTDVAEVAANEIKVIYSYK